MSQEDKKISAALGLLKRLSEAMVLSSVVDGEPSLWESSARGSKDQGRERILEGAMGEGGRGGIGRDR